MADTPDGFVALKSLKKGPPDPTEALAEIRRIYFKTTKKTIDNDFAHAIDLLKSLPDEDTRDKAAVYMEGLAQMRRDWAPADARKPGPVKGHRSKGKQGNGARNKR